MILVMVRHGQTHYNAKGLVQGRINIPLNSTGRLQAQELAESLRVKGDVFDFIASSPLSRALETAYIIKKKLKMDSSIVVVNSFVERDFAHFDGRLVSDVVPFVRQKNYFEQGYETDQELVNRIAKATFDLAKRYPDKQILFIAHAHVIKALRIVVDPDKYCFSDFINNADLVSFEVEKDKITILD